MPLLRVGLCPALTKEDLEALRKGGIRSVEDFVCSDPETIAQTCNISYKVLLSIRKLLLAQYSAFPINGVDLYEDALSKTSILPIGCDSLGRLLDGGLYTLEVTEIAGEAASGKTQSVKAAFNRIHCCNAFDVYQVIQTLEEIRSSIIAGNNSFYTSMKLLVLDSIAAVISPILGGQQTDGHLLMTHLATLLLVLSVEHALAVVVTNNVVQGDGNTTKPALGKYWLDKPHNRILLNKEHQATLVKSTRLPLYNKVMYTITDAGITDVSKQD
uniref:DNA repair protein RAD51 homolog 4-like n=1 Tax=Saccoglossus kowalevskii TaxID=10224 RepID=A0ABM0GSW1_SACKO|nr:PREDICTED: DNA repair protein RAD51 homolog 4-like [Saccoglossus kowalevskii]